MTDGGSKYKVLKGRCGSVPVLMAAEHLMVGGLLSSHQYATS